MRPSLRGVVWLGWGVAALLIAAALCRPARGAGSDGPAPAGLGNLCRPVRPPTVRRPPPVAGVARRPPPSFDIVSVDRRGQAVIAGRAAPGDRVKVLDGDTPIGEVTADARGEWVLVPETPMAPGDRQLGSRRPAGRRPRPPLARYRRAVDSCRAGSPGPDISAGHRRSPCCCPASGRAGADPAAPAGRGRGRKAVARRRRIRRTGPAGAVRQCRARGAAQHLCRRAACSAPPRRTLPANGRCGRPTRPDGAVELRLDQLAGDGSIARRVAAPSRCRADWRPRRRDVCRARGNSLWLIARRVYGNGLRYTAIYPANQATISEPDRIYPGQALRLPQP